MKWQTNRTGTDEERRRRQNQLHNASHDDRPTVRVGPKLCAPALHAAPRSPFATVRVRARTPWLHRFVGFASHIILCTARYIATVRTRDHFRYILINNYYYSDSISVKYTGFFPLNNHAASNVFFFFWAAVRGHRPETFGQNSRLLNNYIILLFIIYIYIRFGNIKGAFFITNKETTLNIQTPDCMIYIQNIV